MNDPKYIGLHVHQATISAAVLDSTAKLESIIETQAASILKFVHGLRGSLQVTWEEGTCAGWLHALLEPHVAKVVGLRSHGRMRCYKWEVSKSDRVDARKLADLLRGGLLSPPGQAAL